MPQPLQLAQSLEACNAMRQWKLVASKKATQSVLLQKAKTACIDKTNNACSNIIIQGRPAMHWFVYKHESLTCQSQL